MKHRLPAVGAVLLGLATGACGAATRHKAVQQPSSTTTAAHTAPATVPQPPPPPRPKPKPKPNPGSLPQTNQLPSAGTAQFHLEMNALWSGVTGDSLNAALPAFFPEGAYVQVKGIVDPQADYRARLLGDYQLDLAAAHALLGANPQSAQLVGVNVPAGYAHWVSPGACYNRVGYYEVPNSRIVYRQGGVLRSFGIASMISWRGVWYVVHLGAVVRAAAAGVVDDPSSGPGESAPSSTC
jgi:hypothetical protein